MLVYRSGKSRDTKVKSAKEEIDRIGDCCTSHNGKICPDKACVIQSSLNNHAMKATMPLKTYKAKS